MFHLLSQIPDGVQRDAVDVRAVGAQARLQVRAAGQRRRRARHGQRGRARQPEGVRPVRRQARRHAARQRAQHHHWPLRAVWNETALYSIIFSAYYGSSA